MIKAVAVMQNRSVDPIYDDIMSGMPCAVIVGPWVWWWLDEKLVPHFLVQKPKMKAPKFKMVAPPAGIEVKMGETFGSFSVVRSE